MIKLRPFSPADFPRLIRAIDSPRLLVQWGGPSQFTFPLSVEQLADYRATAVGSHAHARIYTACDAQGEALGHIELGFIDMQNASASVSRVLVFPAARGRGACTPMIGRVLEIGFGEMGLRRIELRVYAFNTPAIRCYERAGFVREGMLRQAQRVGHEVWDLVVMGILREEWDARAAR